MDDSRLDLRPLRAHTTGDVVIPGERIWSDVLEAWDGLDAGQEPAAVVYPASEYDVAAVLSYVRYAGLTAVVAGRDAMPEDVTGTVLVHRPATRPPWVR